MRVASNLAKNRIDYNRVRDTMELNEEIVGEVQEDRLANAEAELTARARELMP